MAKLAILPTPLPPSGTGFDPLPVPAIQSLLSSGLPRGVVAEAHGPRSCGRTAFCWHVLAQATQRGEICAVVDLHDEFYPEWAAAAGVAIDRVVWVRCGGNAEHALRAADLLLHAGGFGIVLFDLTGASAKVLNRIPLSYWYRFRRAVEHTPTVFLLSADTHQARSAAVEIGFRAPRFRWIGRAPFRVIRAIESTAVSTGVVQAPTTLSISSSSFVA